MTSRKLAVVPSSRVTRPGTPAQIELPAPPSTVTRPISAAPVLGTPLLPQPREVERELMPRPASTPYSLTPFKSPGDSGYETKLIGPHADYFGAKPMLQVLDTLDAAEDVAGKVSRSTSECSDRLGCASSSFQSTRTDQDAAVTLGQKVESVSLCGDSSISSLDLAAGPHSPFALPSVWSSDSNPSVRLDETDSEASFRCRTAAAIERLEAIHHAAYTEHQQAKEANRPKRMSI